MGSPPYWLFQQVLGYLEPAVVAAGSGELSLVAPDLGPESNRAGGYDESDRFRAFQAVSTVLAGAAEPLGLVLVLDDLQWADPSAKPPSSLTAAIERGSSPGPRFIRRWRG